MIRPQRFDGLGPRPLRTKTAPAPVVTPPPRPKKFWSLPHFATLHPVSAGIVAALMAICAISATPRPSHFEALPAALAASGPSPSPLAAPVTSSPTPAVHHPAPPTDRLRIPALGINAPIIHLGITAGQLDAPKTLYQVGWYQGSPWPGRPGTAIIDGHSGAPGQVGVFEHLSRLKPGSLVSVTTAAGASTTFVVRTSAAFPNNQTTANQFFAQTTGPTLNLIGCYGTWDATLSTYDQRWIVTATPQ